MLDSAPLRVDARPSRPVRAARPLPPLWALAVALATAAMALAPLAWLLAFALADDEGTAARIAMTALPGAALETALLLAGVGVLAGAIGIGTAWLVTAHRFPGRRALAWLLPLPLAVPTYITAYVYVELLDAAGPVQGALRALTGWQARGDYWFPEIRSLPGCILVMSVVLYPYVYVAARMMFVTQSAAMVEVARTLGAGRAEIFRTVALPLARPALAVGLALALLEALNDIGASEYLGVRTLTVSVYVAWQNQGSLAAAARIALVMLAVVVLLFALERWGRADRRYTLPTRRPRVAAPTPLPRGAGLLALAACGLPVAAGLGIPLAFLVVQVLSRNLIAQFDRTFLGHLATTVGLAAIATATTLALGIVLVTAARLARGTLVERAKLASGLGYAVPGTVLALGLLGPVLLIDNLLGDLWRAAGGGRLGLVLMGSGAAIVIAYTVRFLPIAVGSLGAGLDRVAQGLDEAARTLGASQRELATRVHLPLLRPALASAALLVFVDCLKELPATLLLRPLNVETLATLIYGHAARGTFEDGALAALLIVLVGLWPVMRLSKSADALARMS